MKLNCGVKSLDRDYPRDGSDWKSVRGCYSDNLVVHDLDAISWVS